MVTAPQRAFLYDDATRRLLERSERLHEHSSSIQESADRLTVILDHLFTEQDDRLIGVSRTVVRSPASGTSLGSANIPLIRARARRLPE